LSTIKEQILNLWKDVKRPGIDPLLDFLNTSDFFIAPCSTQYHLAQPGGLAEHSLNVYNLLSQKCDLYSKFQMIDFPIVPMESIIICALGHDLCKVNYYGKDKRNVKENGRWIEKEVYVVKDQLPLGHGEKSVSILQDFIHLTDVEKLAIRWHMTAFDAGIHFDYPNGFAYRAAIKVHPLVTLLFTADFEASNIIEREKLNHG
jgi:hypothetical protein